MIEVRWKGKMAFEAHTPSGNAFTMDAHEDVGGEESGPTPVEALLSSLAACTAMDVISILRKKQQVITSYRIEVSGQRGPEGVYPRPFTDIVVRHIVQGENVNPTAVARAVELSDEKYCTVLSTLRATPNVVSEWVIEEPVSASG